MPEIYCKAAECKNNADGVCDAPAIDVSPKPETGEVCCDTYAPVQPEYGAFPPGLGAQIPSNAPQPVQPPTGPGMPEQPSGYMPTNLPPY